MFESLATYMCQRFYLDVDSGRIDWYEIVPAGVFHLRESTEINPVWNRGWGEGLFSDVSLMGTRVPIQLPFWGGVSYLQPMRSIVFLPLASTTAAAPAGGGPKLAASEAPPPDTQRRFLAGALIL
jgi:hypothetical protein